MMDTAAFVRDSHARRTMVTVAVGVDPARPFDGERRCEGAAKDTTRKRRGSAVGDGKQQRLGASGHDHRNAGISITRQ